MALEAQSDSLQSFEAACEALQSVDAAQRQDAEAHLIQLRAPGEQNAHGAIALCRQILQTSGRSLAQFHAALILRDVIMRDWAILPAHAVADLRTELLGQTIQRCLTPPGAASFVRQQLLQLLALMHKRVWAMDTDDAQQAKEVLLTRSKQLLGETESGAQALGLQLLNAVLNEFCFARLTAVGISLENHLLARFSFQRNELLPYARVAAGWLYNFASNEDSKQDASQSDAAVAALSILSAALSWNFQSKSTLATASAMSTSGTSAWLDAPLEKVWCPPASWSCLLCGADGERLLHTLFLVAGRAHNSTVLANAAFEPLLALAQLGPGSIWGVGSDLRWQWQRVAIGSALRWLGSLCSNGGRATGSELRAVTGFILRLLVNGASEAFQSQTSPGSNTEGNLSEGVSVVVALKELVTQTMAATSLDGTPLTDHALLEQGEEWQRETVRNALRLWGWLLPQKLGKSSAFRQQSTAASESQGISNRKAFREAVVAQTPAVLEAYVHWRLSWAAAEATAGADEEVEAEWERQEAATEAEYGADGEAVLAGRLAQATASDSLPWLAGIFETRRLAVARSIAAAHTANVANDTSSFTSNALVVAQEQLCAVVELVSATLCGRLRLDSDSVRRGAGRHCVPTSIAQHVHTAPETGQALFGLIDTVIITTVACSEQKPSPYTVQCLLESCAVLSQTYCGVLPTSSVGRNLAHALQLQIAPPTLPGLDDMASKRSAERVEKMLNGVLGALVTWGGVEPEVARQAALSLLVVSQNLALRPYLLRFSDSWRMLHEAVSNSQADPVENRIGDTGVNELLVAVQRLRPPGVIRGVMEAVCRVGLAAPVMSSNPEPGLTIAASEYFSKLSTVYATVLPTLSDPKIWCTGNATEERACVQLGWVCGCLRGLANACSEACTAVDLWSARLSPVLGLLPPIVKGCLAAVSNRPVSDALAQMIGLHQLFKLLSSCAAGPLAYLPPSAATEFYQIVAQCFSVLGEHAEARVLAPCTGDAGVPSTKVLTSILCLLSKLTAKSFVDFADDEAGVQPADTTLVDTVFYGVNITVPMVGQREELLAINPKLSAAFFDLVPFLVENFPKRVAQLPAPQFHVLMQALERGLDTSKSANANDVAKCCLSAIAAMAAESVRCASSVEIENHTGHGSQHAAAIAHFLEHTLRTLLYNASPAELLDSMADALLAMILAAEALFAQLVSSILAQYAEQVAAERLRHAFEALMAPSSGLTKSLDRQNRMVFRHNLTNFVSSTRGFLHAK